MKLHSDKPGPPCKHMEGLLNKTADGSARGLGRWYALLHAVRCSRCRKYLEALKAMISRLRGAKQVPVDVEDRLKEALVSASKGIEG